jgi:hypothetical protein
LPQQPEGCFFVPADTGVGEFLFCDTNSNLGELKIFVQSIDFNASLIYNQSMKINTEGSDLIAYT